MNGRRINFLTGSCRLIRDLPLVPKLAWIAMLFGLPLLAYGFLAEQSGAAKAGLAIGGGGYALALVNAFLMRGLPSDGGGGFQAAVVLVSFFSAVVVLAVALLFGLVIAIMAVFDRASASGVIRTLKFLGILYGFLVVSGLPSLALRDGGATDEGDGRPQ